MTKSLHVAMEKLSRAWYRSRSRWPSANMERSGTSVLAGSMIAAIVPILLVIPFQRYYVQAITGTGLE